MKTRNEWLSSSHNSQAPKSVTSSVKENMTQKEKFFSDQKYAKENDKIKVTVSHNCSNVVHDVKQNGNINIITNSDMKEVHECKYLADVTTDNQNNKCKIDTSEEIVDSRVNGSVKSCEIISDCVNETNVVNKKQTGHESEVKSVSAVKCNNQELASHQRLDVKVKRGNRNDVTHRASSPVENAKENTQEKARHLKESTTTVCNSSNGYAANGEIITNGWSDGKGVEQQEESTHVDTKTHLEQRTPPSKVETVSLDAQSKTASSKEDIESTEDLVKGKRDSKVSKFVRMFSRKDVATVDTGERSSVRRNQSRVWGMCLQGPSRAVDDEDHEDYKKSEGGSIKSEPLIDNSDREPSVDSGHDRGRSSSSFNDIEAVSHQSLDNIISKNVVEKPKDLKLECDRKSRSLIRSGRGRRSFDRPERTAKSFTKRSNTVDEDDSGSKMCSRSSKTLPATPTSGVSESDQDSNASHPFYRRFYSHCMILPIRKRKKETAKKFTEDKNPDIVIDTSPQKSTDLWQNEERQTEHADGEHKEGKMPSATVTIEVFEDSPKKLPVIDDLLAEIMENVTLMELDMNEEEKRLSVHSIMEDGVKYDKSRGLSPKFRAVFDDADEADGHTTSEAKLRRGSDETTRAARDTVDEVSDSDVLEANEGNTVTRSNSRVGSLISKFENTKY